jgi:glutamyl-tRNA reductase
VRFAQEKIVLSLWWISLFHAILSLKSKKLSNVFLYTVDDLKDIIQSGQEHRQAAVLDAEVIIDEGVQKFMSWLEHRKDVPLIRELNLQADAWRQAELSKSAKTN